MVVLGGPEPGARLWALRADGTDARPLTGPEHFAGAPDWSSDGRWIIFPSAQPAPAGFWVIRPDGSGARRLNPTGHRAEPPLAAASHAIRLTSGKI